MLMKIVNGTQNLNDNLFAFRITKINFFLVKQVIKRAILYKFGHNC